MNTDINPGSYGSTLPPQTPQVDTGDAPPVVTTPTKPRGTPQGVGSAPDVLATSGTTTTGTPPPSESPTLPPPAPTAPSTPPTGPSGTGNPFFNTNPMVSITIAFTNMEEVLNYAAWIMNKIGVIDIQANKEAGKAQGAAIIEAGWRNYNADIAQGIQSAVMAGLALIQVAGNIVAFRQARAELKANEEMLTKNQKTAKGEVEDYMKDNPQLTKTQEGLAANKKQFLALREKKEGLSVELEEVKPGTTVEAKSAAKIKADKKALETEIKNVEKQIKDDTEALKDLKGLEQKEQEASKSLKEFKDQKAQRLANLVQNNQLKIIFEMVLGPQGFLGHGTQAGVAIFSAEEHLKAAYWNAYSQIIAMNKEILSKGMDFAFQQWQSLSDQFAKSTDTRSEISQKHVQSFKWG